ncbi:MAG: FAD-dependent oxidoreductase [Polyangiales bacterium]
MLESGSRARTVAIVGGGFAGVALAYHLLASRSELQVTLIERDPLVGRGVAYQASSPLLRLNVPASRMSLDPQQPLDFVRFAGAEQEPGAFLARSLYGGYVGHCLSRAAREHPGRLHVVHDTVLQVCKNPAADGGRGNGRELRLERGGVLHADAVVLATGLSARTKASVLPDDPRVLDAWDEAALSRLPRTARVLVVGSGLTALDVLRLLIAGDHRGEIVVTSRHGLLPRPHAEQPGCFALPPHLLPAPSRLRALISWTRALTRLAADGGVPWQHVMEALRPHTPQIWQALPIGEQRRFVRHARVYWEVLRHRAPRDLLDEVARVQALGQLSVARGRLTACHAAPDALHVTLAGRRSPPRQLKFDAIVPCLGPSLNMVDDSPLLAALVQGGHARLCENGLGLATAEHGSVVDAAGRPQPDLFALGVLCRAERWETTSAPGIVQDAVALAARVAR